MDITQKGPMRAGYFKLRPLTDEIFEGFTMGEGWDGWACPYFTYEVARKIVRKHNEHLIFISFFNLAFYDIPTDSFVFPIDYDIEPKIYRAITENGEKYYQIGAFWWTWKEVSQRLS